MRDSIRDFSIVAALTLAASFCFWQGLSSPEAATPASIATTPVSYVPPVEPQAVAQPIETIRVGQRVWIGENPSKERDVRIGAEIDDPQQWRKMVLRCPKRDGSTAEVEMLRPVWWLEEQDVRPGGGKAEINVPECGIEGLADVLDVRPCPPIQTGQGRVVTATFHHQAAQIIDVAIEGLTEPIGSTPNHPIWSETQQEFVQADALSPGEKVRTANGTALVTSITPRGPPEPVYNLEVQFEHVYRVGDWGVLVHNGGLPIVNPYFHPKSGNKAVPLVFKGFRPHRGKTKTNGWSGSNRRLYEWDHTYGDMEVYDRRDKHLGTIDPVYGRDIKPPVPGREIDI